MIAKYDILNPVIDKTKPYYLKQYNTLYFKLDTVYDYYLLCSRFNKETNDIDYFILFSKVKFDFNCKKCIIDNYGRYKIKPTGKLKEYIISELNYKANFKIEYLETEDNYDIYSLN